MPENLLNPMYQMKRDSETQEAVVMKKGGITFQGANPKTTILTAFGAWQIKGQYVSRGMLLACRYHYSSRFASGFREHNF